MSPHYDDPVIYPNVTVASMTDRICAIALREKPKVTYTVPANAAGTTADSTLVSSPR